MKIYQQIDSQSFHIGTSANEEWFLKGMGALDVEAPVYDKTKEKAKWDFQKKEWIIKSIEEWEAENKKENELKGA
jgi:hypothetical protein